MYFNMCRVFVAPEHLMKYNRHETLGKVAAEEYMWVVVTLLDELKSNASRATSGT